MTNFIAQPYLSDPTPILLDRLKQQLKIIGNSRDDELLGWLYLSIELVSAYTWRTLRERLIVGQFSSTIESRIQNNDCDVLDFSRAPAKELVSVVYKAKAGDEILDAHMAVVGEFGEIFLDSEPVSIDSEVEYPLEATVKCGYSFDGVAWECPEPLQQAVIALAAWAYSNPSSCGSGGCVCSNGSSSNGIVLPHEVAIFLQPYVIRRYDGFLYI